MSWEQGTKNDLKIHQIHLLSHLKMTYETHNQDEISH
jgi:hypothetical protein